MPDVACANCGAPIENESPQTSPEDRRPCSFCGSLGRKLEIRLAGSISVTSKVTANLSVGQRLGQLAVTLDPVRGGIVSAVGSAAGASTATADGLAHSETEETPEILLQAAIITVSGHVEEGQLVSGVATPWLEIARHIKQDPGFLHRIGWRKLEELIAGAYQREGWPEVILTPRSGDGGRDVIASKPGIGSIRILDQVKAYGPYHVVKADEVRAMLGVLEAEQNVSKGFVTTTSTFAPGIEQDPRMRRFMPYRLELKPGERLLEWLSAVAATPPTR